MDGDDDAVRDAVRDELQRFGFNVDDPQEVRKDMAFLTKDREIREKMCDQARIVSVGVVITAVLAALWIGFKSGIAELVK